MTDRRNQCMGCQAGWPISANQFSGHPIHDVPNENGYREIISCTADRYESAPTRAIPEEPSP